MKILYFGDNNQDIQFLKNILKAHFKKTFLVVAKNQQELIDVLSYDGPFGFCMIDTSFKDLGPNVIYDTIIKFIGERPCLFIGNKATITDRVDQEFFERMDENDIILAPIENDIDDLKNKITACSRWAAEQEYEQSIGDVKRDDFIGMRIKSFYMFDTFAYDLYVEVTSTRFLKAIMKNTPFSQGDIQRYVKKGIKMFFVKKDEQLKFLEETIQKCQHQMQTLPCGIELMKTHIIAFSVIQSYVANFGVTESVQNLTENLIDSIPDLCQEKTLPEIMVDFPFNDAGIAVKSVLTAYVCEHLLQKIGWTARSSKAKMIISAILYDAFFDSDEYSNITTLEDEQFLALSDIDKEKFLEHPILASRIANQFSGHSDVDYIIEQHHELPTGDGFPHGWSSMKLSILSCIFITSSNFTNICVGMELNPINIRKIVRYMAKTYNVGNFKEPMKLISEIFGVKI